MFEEIQYQMNAIEIERCKNVGPTTLRRGWLSLIPRWKLIVLKAGKWDIGEIGGQCNDTGYFDVSVPASLIPAFLRIEEPKKILLYIKHELILTRTRNDLCSETNINENQ